jgi:hypothetical protein
VRIAPLAQEQCAERGREGERIERREHRGRGNGECELPIKLARDAAEKRHRHEDRAEHQRDRHQPTRDFVHRL